MLEFDSISGAGMYSGKHTIVSSQGCVHHKLQSDCKSVLKDACLRR